MNELTTGQQELAESSEAVRLAEAAARAAEAEAEKAKAEASVEASNVLGKWEAIALIGVVALIVICVVLSKMVSAGVFN